MPAIATKLSVNTNITSSGRVSPSAVSPMQAGAVPCVECKLFQGTPEHDNMCSTCYRKQQARPASEPCISCKKMFGTAERNGYCSKCYNQFVTMETNESSTDRSASKLCCGTNHRVLNGYIVRLIVVDSRDYYSPFSLTPGQSFFHCVPKPDHNFYSNVSSRLLFT